MRMFSALLAIVLPCIAVAQEANSWHPLLGPHGRGEEDDALSSSYQHFHQPAAPAHTFSSLVAQQYQPPSPHTPGGQCDLYKVGFNQDVYFQYVQYKTDVPELKEFTLCFWNKFLNHSNDHPLFSYAVDGQPRAIVSWVANSMRSSYYSLSVNGHTLYRLNYPLRMNKWYHTCQSWNGKTGEWQIWVNAERVGRGFHNRLVGHTIKGGGIAITGQEQSQLGGGFQEGYAAPKGSGGMLGEFTMLQLYKVALTAGKAHRDHKHHHAHHYDHNGAEITTTPLPPTSTRPTQPSHPLITGGQLNPGAALNIAAQQPQLIQGQQFQSQYLNGQFSPSFVSQQLTQSSQPNQRPQTFGIPQPAPQSAFGIQQEQAQPQPQAPQPALQDFNTQSQSLFLPSSQSQNDLTSYSQQTFTFGGRPLLNSGLINHAEVSAPNADISHNLFKRQNSKERTKRQSDKTKRELILANGQLIDDSALVGLDQSLLDGLAGISDNEPVLQQQMKQEEREPAEAEVKAVMSVCSGCDPEPFSKALVIGWRQVSKKLYSGALYTPANTECRVF